MEKTITVECDELNFMIVVCVTDLQPWWSGIHLPAICKSFSMGIFLQGVPVTVAVVPSVHCDLLFHTRTRKITQISLLTYQGVTGSDFLWMSSSAQMGYWPGTPDYCWPQITSIRMLGFLKCQVYDNAVEYACILHQTALYRAESPTLRFSTPSESTILPRHFLGGKTVSRTSLFLNYTTQDFISQLSTPNGSDCSR